MVKKVIAIDTFDFDSGPTWEEIEKLFAAREALKKTRKERPWVADIIKVLWGTRSSMSMQRLCRELKHIRNPSGLPEPKALENTVQSALNRHTSQSTRWSGKLEDDLFYSPEGKESGRWAVHRGRAFEWLKSHGLSEA